MSISIPNSEIEFASRLLNLPPGWWRSQDRRTLLSVQQAVEAAQSELQKRQPEIIATRFRNDPLGYRRDILGYEHTTPAQVGVLDLLRAGHTRIAVKAGHGVGKTNLAASIVNWWLDTRTPSIVVTTATSWAQVERLLWGEIHKQRPNAKVTLPGRLNDVDLTIDAEQQHFAVGISTNKEVNFQGYHSPNLLVLIDEAGGVPAWMWDAAETLATGESSTIISFGNPTDPTAGFSECFGGRKSRRWQKQTISCLTHPNVLEGREIIPGAVTRDWVGDKVEDYCERVGANEDATCFEWPVGSGQWYKPSPWFCAHVLGTFPATAIDSLIPLAYLEAAAVREPLKGEYGKLLAVDVARYGDDRTVITAWEGPNLLGVKVFHGNDTMEVVGLCRQAKSEFSAGQIYVDSIGIGAGVADRLRELGLDCMDVNCAESATEEGLYQLRDEIGWTLREGARTGQLTTSQADREHVDALNAEASSIKYRASFGSTGKKKIESKEEMKKRGMRSPDIYDSAAMGYWAAMRFVSGSTAMTTGKRILEGFPA